ncbi:MAG: AsnC family protein [Chitinophagaceae bacterium]
MIYAILTLLQQNARTTVKEIARKSTFKYHTCT